MLKTRVTVNTASDDYTLRLGGLSSKDDASGGARLEVAGEISLATRSDTQIRIPAESSVSG